MYHQNKQYFRPGDVVFVFSHPQCLNRISAIKMSGIILNPDYQRGCVQADNIRRIIRPLKGGIIINGL